MRLIALERQIKHPIDGQTYPFHKKYTVAWGLKEDGVKIINDSYFCFILLALGKVKNFEVFTSK